MNEQLDYFAEDDGFTLLETLITITIISLLSMVIVSALNQVRTMSAISHRTDHEVRYGAILNYLEATLAAARPLRLLGRGENSIIVMDGGIDRLDFVTIAKTGTVTQSLREVIWAQSEEGKQSQFTQFTKPRRLQPELQSGDRNILAGGDLSVSFRYLAADQQRADDQLWLREWKSDHLPSAVKIEIQSRNDSRQILMTRIVPLALGQTSSR